MLNNQKVGAIIVAAGRGERMGDIDKMFANLGGKPVLARSVSVFEASPLIDQVVIVLGEHNIERGKKLLADEGWPKVTDVCAGGKRRQDSVAAGLKRLKDCRWVLVHDGARPLVTADLISAGLEAAKESGAAACAVPVRDTIKMAGDDGFVIGTPPRQKLWTVQTPQVFRSDIITDAYRQTAFEATDDASLVERAGGRVRLYRGSYGNIKITTPEDLALAGVLWQKRGD
jgi:2-C-methyl-D-erythritol 4-phosphate cytidylyltransferase